MSTNYYFKPGYPHRLHPYGSVHIGKTAGGWSFSFKGHDVAVDHVNAEVSNGLVIRVPLPTSLHLNVRSWADWKALLSEPGGHIEDEYGHTLGLDEFVHLVEVDFSPDALWGGKRLLNHTTMLRTDPRYRDDERNHDDSQFWLDAQGYSFSLGEFS